MVTFRQIAKLCRHRSFSDSQILRFDSVSPRRMDWHTQENSETAIVTKFPCNQNLESIFCVFCRQDAWIWLHSDLVTFGYMYIWLHLVTCGYKIIWLHDHSVTFRYMWVGFPKTFSYRCNQLEQSALTKYKNCSQMQLLGALWYYR